MTGARIAHPLLLGLANIRMHTRTKLSSKTFMLMALLPIPKYLHPNQRMRGMLEDCLVHECLSIFLKPLMIAAEVGIMMSDPVGNVRHCFTPLAAYIVDTPEAAMLVLGIISGTPAQPLHHWHKEFFDHDLQWCFKVVGAQELDFRFSILQPITGYRHFAAPHRFVIAICALMDVWYLAQCPAPDADLLSWARMGAKKPIDNWFIPKLELLQSITSSMRKMQTEHAHVSEIKDPARHTNDNDYDPQIYRYLDRQEKLQCFTITTTLKSHNPADVAEENEGEEDNIDPDEWEPSDPRTALLEEMNQTRITTNYFSKAKQNATLSRRELAYPPRTFIGGATAIHLNYDPSQNGVKVGDISVDYNIPDLHVLLSDFLQCDARGRGVVHEVASRRRPSINCPPILPFDHIQVWHSVRLQQTSFHDSSIVLPPRLYMPLLRALDGPKADGILSWSHNLVLSIGPIDPATGMHTLERTKHADGSPVGNFVLLNQLRAFISVIPRLGDVVDV
ncbi:hypothetical protein DFJ58DRAFT_843203 [Suillus subalutaceus]|uniref:uncharacterized protein n=1 Tax=Suillus subalutaceus TaxID=48586 RepID=UPI001B8633D9|nr:uncharacterized protein DFJ58DRAFT_843203 [Suillus subalutaceus]KAG1847303.1 hypothetical protein DFJ58DRAFT_843203 [Suillus subalutaceus]